MFFFKKLRNHAELEEDFEESQLDFAWLTFIGMQIGYTEKEVNRMYLGKWDDMYQNFKWLHNMRVSRTMIQQKKQTSLLDL